MPIMILKVSFLSLEEWTLGNNPKAEKNDNPCFWGGAFVDT